MRVSRTLGLLLATICASTVMVIPTSSTAATPSAGTATTSGPTCVEVFLLGARGSGQYAEGGDQYGGYGPQIFQLGVALVQRLEDAGRIVETQPLAYPASSTNKILFDKAGYVEGIEQGVTNALAVLDERRKACPNERIVLAGYSQGAMVMHRVLRRLLSAKISVASIDGVVLIADGDRVSNDNTTFHGTASPSTEGVGQNISGSGSSPSKLPVTLQPIVHSICNQGDNICGEGLDSRVHARYRGTPEVIEAVDDVVERVAVRFPQS